MDTITFVGFIILGFIAALVIFLVGYIARERHFLEHNGIRVAATVTSISLVWKSTDVDGPDVSVYSIWLRFYDPRTSTWQTVEREESGRFTPPVRRGDTVTIFLHPQNLQSFLIKWKIKDKSRSRARKPFKSL